MVNDGFSSSNRHYLTMIVVCSMSFAVFGVILTCLLLLEIALAESRPGFYEKLPEQRFSNVITSISTTSAIACCGMCEITGTCSLVSYHKQSRTCDLGNFRPGDDALIEPMAGWNLYINSEDDCASNPCMSSGTCQDNIGHYTCSCSVGWTGVNCETELCPLGWDQVGSSCYYIDTSLQTWTSAKVTCSVSGGHLLRINTATENNYVMDMFNTKHPGESQQVWIGGQDVNSNEIFYWTDGALVSNGFEFWFTDQPDNWNGVEDCMLLRSYQGFTWNDGDCASEFWSICEKEL